MTRRPAPRSATRQSQTGIAGETAHVVDDALAPRRGRRGPARPGSYRRRWLRRACRRDGQWPRPGAPLFGGGDRVGEVRSRGPRSHVEQHGTLPDHALGRAQEVIGAGDHRARIEGSRTHVEGADHGHGQTVAQRNPCQSRSDGGGHATKIPLPASTGSIEFVALPVVVTRSSGVVVPGVERQRGSARRARGAGADRSQGGIRRERGLPGRVAWRGCDGSPRRRASRARAGPGPARGASPGSSRGGASPATRHPSRCA